MVQSRNCPAQFGAQRWTGYAGRLTVGTEVAALQQGVYLRPVLSDAILSVRALVRGATLTSRLQPASPRRASDRTQVFQLANTERDREGNWKLTVTEMPVVREIDITEIVFASGTTWHSSSNEQCRIEPNGFLLVASGR